MCVCGTFLVISKTGSAVPFHFLSALGTSTDLYVSKCLPVGINGRIDWLCFPKLLDFAWQLYSSCGAAA